MKAIPFRIPKSDHTSILVQKDEGKNFYDRLHYHSECQITAIVKGKGLLYTGNSMLRFSEGDILFIGASTPHLLKNSSIFFTDESPGVLSYSIFFDQLSAASSLFDLQEMKSLVKLIDSAKRGIIIKKKDSLCDKIIASLDTENEQLIFRFLDILIDIKESEKTYINIENYQVSLDEKVGERLNNIIEYTFKNMSSKIDIESVSAIANLSKSQFSRYFKKQTGKTYITFLNQIRIESACSQLLDTTIKIETICYDVGFSNVSNFNRQFKIFKGLSPKDFRKKYMIK